MKLITKKVITDIHSGEPYLIRWSLWLPFGYSIKLHKILRADEDRCDHDHPFAMLRIILWGGYREVCGEERKPQHCKPWRPWAPWRMYYCPVGFRHRITELLRSHSWTLAWCGNKQRDWGFFTKNGFMHWKQFVNEAWAKRVLWCDDGRNAGTEQKEVPK